MITRRGFLGRAALTALVATLANRRLGPRPALAAGTTTPLDDAELASVDAFAEVLVPSSFEPAVAGPVVRRIVRDLGASDPAPMRAAVTLLDEAAVADTGARFAALDVARRRTVVDALLGPYAARNLFTNPYYYLTTNGRRTRLLWWQVAKPVIVGFYRSPLGWQLVGYARRPGQCSNLTDYQLPVPAGRDPRPDG